MEQFFSDFDGKGNYLNERTIRGYSHGITFLSGGCWS
nr:MAG TPA: hypothetical protein [Caudoviricetes sp.]